MFKLPGSKSKYKVGDFEILNDVIETEEDGSVVRKKAFAYPTIGAPGIKVVGIGQYPHIRVEPYQSNSLYGYDYRIALISYTGAVLCWEEFWLGTSAIDLDSEEKLQVVRMVVGAYMVKLWMRKDTQHLFKKDIRALRKELKKLD